MAFEWGNILGGRSIELPWSSLVSKVLLEPGEVRENTLEVYIEAGDLRVDRALEEASREIAAIAVASRINHPDYGREYDTISSFKNYLSDVFEGYSMSITESFVVKADGKGSYIFEPEASEGGDFTGNVRLKYSPIPYDEISGRNIESSS